MSRKEKRPIAWGRLSWFVAGVAASSALSWQFAQSLPNSPDVLSMIATVFSILAAALIAIISILGDPSMLQDQSWRHNTVSSQETQRKLHRQTNLFIGYLLILCLLLGFMLTDKDSVWFVWVQRATFFSVGVGFWQSLSLPATLKAIQRKRLEDAIGARREVEQRHQRHQG